MATNLRWTDEMKLQVAALAYRCNAHKKSSLTMKKKWSTILTANSYIICQPKQMDHTCTSSDLFEIIQNHSNCKGIYGTSEKNQGHQHRPSNLIIFEIRATLVHTVAVMRVDTFLQTQETREYRVGLPTKSFKQLQGFQEQHSNQI